MAQYLTWHGDTGLLNLSDFPPPPRRIEGGDGQIFIAQVVVDEDADDDLVITEHPVSGGAVIHDHAFKRPAEVRVRMGWSNAFLSEGSAAGQTASNVRQLYEQILTLQASRLPSTILTGKRQYDNMLLASLRTHTDQSLEYSFIADISFREVVLTSTATFNVGQLGQGALVNPQTATYTINGGTYQLLPGNVNINVIPPTYGLQDYDFWLNEQRNRDQPTNPEQAVFHTLPSRVMGPAKW